jgi:hypothetical protein
MISPEEPITDVAIADLVIDSKVQVRHSEHRATVDRYKESLDSLPPVVAYETPEGLLLSDGFHRIKAHTRSGRSTIAAHIRPGTREDALEYAVTGNCRHGAALTPDERDAGIRRLHRLHPDWAGVQIAEKMSVHRATVDRVLQAHSVRQSVGASAGGLSRAVLTNIERAPAADRAELARIARDEGFTADETKHAAETLRAQQFQESLAPRRYDADHGERLKVGRAEIKITYMVPSGRTRNRGGQTYDRENVPIERRVSVNLGPEAFEPGKTGAVATANAIAKQVYATLMTEGWPVPLTWLSE